MKEFLEDSTETEANNGCMGCGGVETEKHIAKHTEYQFRLELEVVTSVSERLIIRAACCVRLTAALLDGDGGAAFLLLAAFRFLLLSSYSTTHHSLPVLCALLFLLTRYAARQHPHRLEGLEA